MQQIFVNQNVQIDTETVITGEDVRHLNKVLRMQPREILRISTHEGDNYLGEITAIDDTQVVLHIIEEVPSTELKQRIYLFQAIPKGDRMETVIEKAVELGVYEIIPVEMKYCVVKLDDKKKKKRIERYQTIAETAAKQSKRSIIPTVHDVMTYKEAVEYARICDVNLVPYECKEGMAATTAAMAKVTDADSISIIIGPEGGFADEEIDMVSDMDIISLGKRILRTDTAAIAATTMVMLACED